jgi:hypothetical protein
MFEGMGAGHFIFIPAVLLVGVVMGWILGSRAARDAYAAELRRREGRSAGSESRPYQRPESRPSTENQSSSAPDREAPREHLR